MEHIILDVTLKVRLTRERALETWSDAHVRVETGDRLRGAMLADYSPDPDERRVNAHVAREVDASSFTQLFQSRLKETP